MAKRRVLTVDEVGVWVPWEIADSAEARAASRRIASLLQARAFLVSQALKREPTNTMSEGIVGMLVATNATIVEELLVGFLSYTHGRRGKAKRSSVRELLTHSESIGAILPRTLAAASRLIDDRHAFIHADRGRVLPARSPRLTEKAIWRRSHYGVPMMVGDDLRRSR